MAFVAFDRVSYKYPTHVTIDSKYALREVSFSVEKGELIAILGANDAGKSTLCHTIAGFIPHFYKGEFSGSVIVDELNLLDTNLSNWVLNVGLVFQNPFNQISGSKFTVYEEIAFGLENTGVAREEMPAKIEKVMSMTRITDLADRSPLGLSGGQLQRVALASILVMEPKVLVLDEPTSQLDPIGTREVFQVIKEMSERGMTVIMAEHKIEWIAEFADRVIALHEGEILLQGSPEEVLTSPLLPERGFGISRYTAVARQAAQEGLWPKERRLPVTLQEAVQGFSEGLR